jgi:hypothetical protein
MLNTQTLAVAQLVRRERAMMAMTASSPATKSPHAAGTAKAGGNSEETTPGTMKLSPMKRRKMCGATKIASAEFRALL